jgi:transcriptional regulator with XRE-family HTH domain
MMASKNIALYRRGFLPPLGEWLRQLRKARGLALREVAAAVGMDQAHLSKAELGQRLPTTEQVRKLAGFFQEDASLMEGKRVAEKVMQEVAASPAAEQAMSILREEPFPISKNQ